MKDSTINSIPYILVMPTLILGIVITYTAATPWGWWVGGALMALGFDGLLRAVAETIKERYVR